MVTHVRDGNTLECESKVVRLHGIDAPESNQTYGGQAGQALHALVEGQTVRVETHGWGDYGRVIGTVYLGERNVNAWLVRQGHAWVHDRCNEDPRFPRSEEEARKAERGLWEASAPVPPWQWREGASKGNSSGQRGRDCSDSDAQEAAQRFLRLASLETLIGYPFSKTTQKPKT